MDINWHSVAIWYFAIINVAAVIFYAWDKLCAIRKWWRVPELTLLLIASVGGSIGAFAAMRLFHHKTLHLKFKYGVPLIMVLQIVGLVYLHIPK